MKRPVYVPSSDSDSDSESDSAPTYKWAIERRPARDTTTAELAAFQDGTKRIAIFSTACATGISLHADGPEAKKRVQIMGEVVLHPYFIQTKLPKLVHACDEFMDRSIPELSASHPALALCPPGTMVTLDRVHYHWAATYRATYRGAG